uniref:Uncharacterized protein n=1 Tax=Cacopsylla melanoneura TaxID=428564 RepID=A0A8D9BJV1_9HEMI
MILYLYNEIRCTYLRIGLRRKVSVILPCDITLIGNSVLSLLIMSVRYDQGFQFRQPHIPARPDSIVRYKRKIGNTKDKKEFTKKIMRTRSVPTTKISVHDLRDFRY